MGGYVKERLSATRRARLESMILELGPEAKTPHRCQPHQRRVRSAKGFHCTSLSRTHERKPRTEETEGGPVLPGYYKGNRRAQAALDPDTPVSELEDLARDYPELVLPRLASRRSARSR